MDGGSSRYPITLVDYFGDLSLQMSEPDLHLFSPFSRVTLPLL
jgi:hypothetical protein